MENENLEYQKSRYRCPICGAVVGFTPEWKLTESSDLEFKTHITECRERNRVKPNKLRMRT